METLIKLVNDHGVTVQNQKTFAQEIHNYGFHEIFDQYWPCFSSQNDDDKLQFNRAVDFADIDALYHLDQRLKNVMMISLQLFEQSFKTTLVRVIDNSQPLDQLLQESHQLSDGHIIRRGDLKARIRHIKRNFHEPYPGYKKEHHHQITTWVLIKEMSFGIATNTFFLLPHLQQEQVLRQIFNDPMTISAFEKFLAEIRTFRGLAAHNYRLINVKADHQFLYSKIVDDLALLSNPDPYQLAKSQLQATITDFLPKHPEFKELLKVNFENIFPGK